MCCFFLGGGVQIKLEQPCTIQIITLSRNSFAWTYDGCTVEACMNRSLPLTS